MGTRLLAQYPAIAAYVERMKSLKRAGAPLSST